MYFQSCNLHLSQRFRLYNSRCFCTVALQTHEAAGLVLVHVWDRSDWRLDDFDRRLSVQPHLVRDELLKESHVWTNDGSSPLDVLIRLTERHRVVLHHVGYADRRRTTHTCDAVHKGLSAVSPNLIDSSEAVIEMRAQVFAGRIIDLNLDAFHRRVSFVRDFDRQVDDERNARLVDFLRRDGHGAAEIKRICDLRYLRQRRRARQKQGRWILKPTQQEFMLLTEKIVALNLILQLAV